MERIECLLSLLGSFVNLFIGSTLSAAICQKNALQHALELPWRIGYGLADFQLIGSYPRF
jgi:hypothetical protein